MELIGNDIIDWHIAKSQYHKLRPRCLEKLFNAFEIDLILKSNSPLKSFWTLWSIKESTYKAWQRATDSAPVFNPKSIKINSFNKVFENIASSVSINSFDLCIHTEITTDYIYSYVASKIYCNKIFRVDEYSVFKGLLEQKNYAIVKSDTGIPSVLNKNNKQNAPLSISHDGQFVAIAFNQSIIEEKIYNDLHVFIFVPYQPDIKFSNYCKPRLSLF